ncbi:MAG: flavodoxin family protein [Desulfobacterales bacterium]|nr:flavodoxin family protein [Desulfobacterales bacterium]
MKITTIMGSPRSGGNTDHVLSLAESLMEKDHEVSRINVSDHDIRYCKGCFSCKKTQTEPGCVIRDDMPELYEVLMASDAIIYASPLYGKSCTAQLKTFLDRQYALLNFTDWVKPETTSLTAGIPTAFLITCGGPDNDFNTAIVKDQATVFNKVMKSVDLDLFLVPHCISPDRIGDAGKRVAADLAGAVEASAEGVLPGNVTGPK